MIEQDTTRRLLRVAVVTGAAALVLAACATPGATRSAATPSRSASSASPSPSPSVSAPPVGVDLPLDWVTPSLRKTGTGFAMTLLATSHPDVYDGRFFQRAANGAISNQVFVTVTLTSRTTVDVRFPDAPAEPGLLALEEDGNRRTTIDLGPACVAALPAGANASDCVLIERGTRPLGTASPSPSATGETPSPDSTAAVDQAMSYLCSVDVADLPKLTRGTADSYATSVLQVALELIGYSAGTVDGVYGPTTRAAVRAYQTDASLTVDGLVGPETWTSLQTDACRVPTDPAE